MNILYFFLAAIALGVLVFIHELGHYLVARKTGMIVEVFSIGFGRPIFKWKFQGVDWQIGWLPFGGYVKILGMEMSKKDQLEPYDIPNGFFSKSPIKRIAVAAAGPLANFLLALLIFVGLWFIGGRFKPFSEYTQMVGWVDPKSEIFALGVRPGDKLFSYNDRPFTGSKDLVYAAMMGGEQVTLKGESLDYLTGQVKPFTHTVTPYALDGAIEGLQTTGLLSTARYLIFDPLKGGITEGSPLEGKGLAANDRLVWADGELLFSMEQLSAIANNPNALLTIQRGASVFLSRQPRLPIYDLNPNASTKEEWMDWKYELGLSEKFTQLYAIPYNYSMDGIIEAGVSYLDESILPQIQGYYPKLDLPLKAGDKIIAVDGQPVSSGIEVFQALQLRKIALVIQSQAQPLQDKSLSDADLTFASSWDPQLIKAVGQTLGSSQNQPQGNYRLLSSIEPKSILDFALSDQTREKLLKDIENQTEQIALVKDQVKREQLEEVLKESYNKKILGIALIDQQMRYNPNPFCMFGQVFVETWQTLKALVTGYLHPKWLSGPVGIVRVIHHGWKVGLAEALFWIGAISVNLGFLNLMPIPVLDGGYICLALFEWITGKKIKAKTMERIILPFVILLIGLLVFLTFQDISRLLGF